MSTNLRIRWRPGAWAAAWMFVAAVGCGGGEEATVRGVVTLDGQPLGRGSVTFVPQESGAGASATISPDGTFTARTGNAEGLKPGEYLITVRASSDPTPNPQGGPPVPGKLITPAKYGRSETSGLRATINLGTNDVKLELSSNAT